MAAWVSDGEGQALTERLAEKQAERLKQALPWAKPCRLVIGKGGNRVTPADLARQPRGEKERTLAGCS
jgi:hypothetical protein